MASSLNGKRLVLGALNCQGIKEKVDQTIFSDVSNQMDIFGVCETWLKDDQTGVLLFGTEVNTALPSWFSFSVETKQCGLRLWFGTR